MYTQTANNLIAHGAFTTSYNEDGTYTPELFRTPGYPFFIGILNKAMKIPYAGIILVQIVLTILVALITYKTALVINPKLAYLSSLIVLYDPPVTIFSMMLLTETLFLLLISVFMLIFVRYVKEKRIWLVILSALIIAMATYVRPIAFFLGAAMGIFVIYLAFRTKLIKLLMHVLVFLLIIYSFLSIWSMRNYRVAGRKTFSTVAEFVVAYKKYYRHDDAITKSLPPVLYYSNAVSRCFLSLMTTPGTLKNFNSPLLKEAGKIFGYPWMVFWLIGFLFGISKTGKNPYLQFLLFVVLYFICASIGGILFGVSSRQRVPMVPFIAILSAHGWIWIMRLLKKPFQQSHPASH
ncbi:glycosyltransferase family 39 protein [Candidatus Omnitrophota bacterium]